ncbi:MAG: FUSC family protein [Oscillospiraceae bacterium]|nr:FUSC family protein [Oscillospiraceae bacterium]
MLLSILTEDRERTGIPRIGQRIIKTAVAVFLSLLYYYLRGYRGQDMPAEAAITVIICMQPYVRDTRNFAISRFAGTLVGTFWGLVFLLTVTFLPFIGNYLLLTYALMAVGTLLSLYSAVLLRRSDASGLAAIVFICIVIAFPEIDEPLKSCGARIFGVLLGTVLSIAVNVFRLPRWKNGNLVFFIRIKDLIPDRFSQLSPTVLFRLNALLADGAKICLMSEHAPAFFTMQLNAARLDMPMIVMDGAAIYDTRENAYIFSENIPPTDSVWLMKELDLMEVSHFIYTIHNGKACIFHQGEYSSTEKAVYEQMRRSPYRSYLEGDKYELEEVVYIKIIGDEETIRGLRAKLIPELKIHGLRCRVRPQSEGPGIFGLYVYSDQAGQKHAENRLMQMLREKEPALEPVEVFLKGGFRSEHDAVQLLNVLRNSYEPIKLLHRDPMKAASAAEK